MGLEGKGYVLFLGLLVVVMLGLLPVDAASQTAGLEDLRQVELGDWTVVFKADPFTDVLKFVMAMGVDEFHVDCDSDLSPRARVLVMGFPPLGVVGDDSSVDVYYRIGREPAQTGTWRATTGKRSSISVPDSLIKDVLLAERLVIRVDIGGEEHIEQREWNNGGGIYKLISTCLEGTSLQDLQDLTVAAAGEQRRAAPWQIDGTGNSVFDKPSEVKHIRVEGFFPSVISNFMVHCGGELVINEIIGTSKPIQRYSGVHVMENCGTIEITNSSGVEWSFTEVR